MKSVEINITFDDLSTIRSIFEDILVNAVEGIEFMDKLDLARAVERDSLKGIKLCDRVIE